MTSAPWWEQFFDEDYLRVWATVSTDGDEEAAALWRILGLSASSRVLDDAGCGYGRVSPPLARLGARVLGVDQSAPLLAEAERRRGALDPEQLRYVRHDLRSRSPSPASMSRSASSARSATVTSSDDAAILGTLAAAVRPGGRVAVDTMHRDVLAARLAREAVPAHRLPDGTLLLEEPRFDPIAGRVETSWFWSGPRGSGQKSASIRVYTITELVRLLERVGLRLEAALHPGTGAPFSAAGPALGGRVLLVAVS